MKTSLIIATRNRGSLLKKCLNSIKQQTIKPNEIVIIDNNSTDNTKQTILAFSNNLPIKHFFEKRVGYSHAKNTGIKKSTGDLLLFTDDDCVAEKNWLKELTNCFEDKNVFLAAGEVESLETSQQTQTQKFLNKKNNCSIKKQFSFLKKGASANLAARKQLFQKIGYFDESMPSQEDTDLFWRAQEAGFQVRLNDKAIVFHQNEKTILGFAKQIFRYGKGSAFLAKKHRMLEPNYFNQNKTPKAVKRILQGITIIVSGVFSNKKEKILFGLEEILFNLGLLYGKIVSL